MRLARNLVRGWALCLGMFALVNLFMAWRDGGVDPNLWWIDLRWAPFPVGTALALIGGLALVFVGACPRGLLPLSTKFTRPVFVVLFAVSVANGIAVLRVFHQGQARGGGLPLSFFVALLFLGLHELVRHSPEIARPYARKDFLGHFAGVLSFGVLFPLSLVWTFGSTNYAGELVMAAQRGARGNPVAASLPAQQQTGPGRNGNQEPGSGRASLALTPPANETVGGRVASLAGEDGFVPGALHASKASDGVVSTAVVFGAGVRPNGEPSMALFDRTRTAIDLYKDGVVERLYFSGGPGPNGQHEVDAMMRLEIAEGVPQGVWQLDRFGFSSGETAAHAARDLSGKIYSVSHGYHLPRIELAFWEHGKDVLTVPARETKPLLKRHYYTLREVPGFWAYWAKRGWNAVWN